MLRAKGLKAGLTGAGTLSGCNFCPFFASKITENRVFI